MRGEEACYKIHDRANRMMKEGNLSEGERVYREALKLFPDKAEMLLGLAAVLAMEGKAKEAVLFAEKGLPRSENEKQKATLRAVLCFLYLQNGEGAKALALASSLPHTRESREVIKPKIEGELSAEELHREIRYLILGE